jgi:Ras association domain-containing protein 2/4
VQLEVLYHISIFVRDIPYMESLSNLFITRVFEISWPLVNKIKRNETRAPFYSCPDDRSEKTVDSETVQNPLENGTTDQLSPLKMSISKDDTWLENSNHLNRSMSGPDCLGRLRDPQSPEFDRSSITSTDISTMSEALGDVVIRRPAKTGSTAIRRRPGKRLSRSKVKRRCSINGHFYDRETSFFTPPHGSQTSVWVTSLVNTQEVINLMLDKYKVDSDGSNFALFVVRDNGEQRRLKEEEYPLLTRVLLGPHEDVAKLFLMDSHNTPEVSSEVAQFLNLSLAECRAILNQYYSQEEKEVARLKEKYQETRRRMLYRMDEMKSSL